MTVVTFGETMGLVRTVGTGPLMHATTLELGVGGSESNVAVALRRLGTDVTWIGRLGDDSIGDLVERELRAEGVLVHALRDPSAPTGLMIKERRIETATRVWYYRTGSAASRFTVGDVPDAVWNTATLLHVTGITAALSDSAAKATAHYMEHARALGVSVSLDLNYRRALWTTDDARPVLRSLAALADIVFAGHDEAEIVVGEGTPREVALRLCELGPAEAIVKLGAAGAHARIEGRSYESDAMPVSVVDSVGAGDGFVAGYLAERLAGRGPQDRLRTAAAVGAFACTVAGDWEGVPRRDELPLLTAQEPVTR